MKEVTPSLYVFVKEQNAINARKTSWWVAFNYFLYMVSLELQIPFGMQQNDTKRF
jgi:hypothetical protein